MSSTAEPTTTHAPATDNVEATSTSASPSSLAIPNPTPTNDPLPSHTLSTTITLNPIPTSHTTVSIALPGGTVNVVGPDTLAMPASVGQEMFDTEVSFAYLKTWRRHMVQYVAETKAVGKYTEPQNDPAVTLGDQLKSAPELQQEVKGWEDGSQGHDEEGEWAFGARGAAEVAGDFAWRAEDCINDQGDFWEDEADEEDGEEEAGEGEEFTDEGVSGGMAENLVSEGARGRQFVAVFDDGHVGSENSA